MSSKNKKIYIASGIAVAVVLTLVGTLYLPSYAAAQQMMMAQPYWMGDGSTMTNMYGYGNRTHLAMPNITGSINIPKLITDLVKVSFSDAAKTAEGQVDGGKVIGGHIGIVQGYLVYSFKVVNLDHQTAYAIIVDAGNGSVLYKSDGFQLGSFGERFGGGLWGMHKPGGMMLGHHYG